MRKFLSVWQSGRPWLKYLEDRKLMVCSWCTVSVSPSVPRDIKRFIVFGNVVGIPEFETELANFTELLEPLTNEISLGTDGDTLTVHILFGPVNLRHKVSVRIVINVSVIMDTMPMPSE
jgi:hypothetical protein